VAVTVLEASAVGVPQPAKAIATDDAVNFQIRLKIGDDWKHCATLRDLFSC
jgi:hypothetical protein